MRTLFEISRSGLRAAEKSLSVTANNITNADTPGYTRQRVEQSAVGMKKTEGHIGLGVNIHSVARLRNEMNDFLMNEKRQDMGFMQGKARVFEQLEASMSTDTGGDLDLRMSRFFDAFLQLSSDPQDLSVRNNLISEATQLTAKLGDLNRNVERTGELLMESGIKTVESVNNLIKEIGSLNQSIKIAGAQGKEDYASLDLRVQKLAELSELVNYETRFSTNGAVEISVGGITILDENKSVAIRPETSPVDNIFRLRLENGKVLKATGGKLGAEIEMYEKEIPNLKNRLDQVAATLVSEFNAIHTQGYGLEDNTVRNFFDPDFTSASDIRVNETIIANHNHIAASTEAGEAGNGDLAIMMADLRNKPVVNGSKLVDYSVDLISTPGTKLSDLRSQITAREAEIHMLDIQQERESGVNIDEELSMMIKYQNAYQGAAKVMGAAQNMYDTLIGILR